MRQGINPKEASPARRRSERTSAGRMEVTKTRAKAEDQSTTSLGGSQRSTTASLEFEGVNHAVGTLPSFSSVTSILSLHRCVMVSAAVRQGNSSAPTPPASAPGQSAKGEKVRLDMDYRHGLVQINDIDRENPIPQSMNAVAGENPEAAAVTEVTRTKSQRGPAAGSSACLPPPGLWQDMPGGFD